MKKEILIWVDLDSQKLKKSVTLSIQKLKGIDSITEDRKKKTLTVVGDVDPVKLVTKIRKIVKAELISVHPLTPEPLGTHVFDKSFQPASILPRTEANRGVRSSQHNTVSKGKSHLHLSPEEDATQVDFDQYNPDEFLEELAHEFPYSPMDETAAEFRLSFERRMQNEEELPLEDREGVESMKQRYERLIRKKDYLHLVLSYPVVPEPDDYFRYGNDHNLLIFSVNQQLRLVETYLSHYTSDKYGNESIKEARKQINEAFQSIEEDLAIYDFNMVAYLPQVAYPNSDESLIRRVELGLTNQSSGILKAPDEMLELAIESATRQILECVEYMGEVFHKIGVSGSGGRKVAEALEDSPLIKGMYGDVVYVSVLPQDNIKDIEEHIARKISKLLGNDHISRGSLKYLPQKYLLLVNCVDDVHTNLHDLIIPDNGHMVLFTQTQSVYEIMQVDLEIRMEDHMLPWTLFCRNLYPTMNSSSKFLHLGIRLVQKCRGHLLAINLLARALTDASDDLSVWRLALEKLTSEDAISEEGISNIMFRVLKLIWDRKDITTKSCIYRCSTVPYVPLRDSLSLSIFEGIVPTVEKLQDIFEELVNSFLVENVGDGHIRMRQEVKIVLENFFVDQLSNLNLNGQFGIYEAVVLSQWVMTKAIYLMDNKISKLPERPSFLFLRKLWLNNNYELMEIPESFFEEMPVLQFLDLSCTSITSLPPSISSLKSLETFYLKSCELLMELPTQIGNLKNLEVFDLKGTELMYLPREIENLTSLRCFKLSFCTSTKHFKDTKHTERTIPFKAFLKLSQLYELSIDANTDDEWWIADLRALLLQLGCLKKLRILRLSLPSVELLKLLKWDGTKPMYTDLFQFSFTVGRHRQRIISRLPDKVEKMFQKWENSKKCVIYVNGEAIPVKLMEILSYATAFFLDRHWTIKVLSDFGNVNFVKLRFCLLVECNELQSVFDGDYGYGSYTTRNPLFGRLQYLGIHYMKNLLSIWRGRVEKGCLSNLKCLAIHTCPLLTVVFTPDLLVNLVQLEEIIVEDCPKIGSLVSTEDFSVPESGFFLQKLRRMSLLDLPELTTISGSLIIAPALRSLIVYQCPKLKSLSTTDVCSSGLKIKGEKEWWDESQWGSRRRPDFVELERGEDLMDNLSEEIYGY